MTCIMKPVKSISRWLLLKLKLFKLKMTQLSFFLSDSYGKAHDCFTPWQFKKWKMCSEILKNVLSKVQRKEPDI